MKLIQATKRFKYFENDYNHKTTHDTGEYDMLTCGCHRQPVQQGKTHLSTAFCAVHKKKTLLYGILDTTPIDGFEYDEDGCVILK